MQQFICLSVLVFVLAFTAHSTHAQSPLGVTKTKAITSKRKLGEFLVDSSNSSVKLMLTSTEDGGQEYCPSVF
jgi:hypothetical protein